MTTAGDKTKTVVSEMLWLQTEYMVKLQSIIHPDSGKEFRLSITVFFFPPTIW